MYQALYRKWRPRTFDDVVGQTHITETLKRQVAAGRLSHAYLFTGTRGTGKTTCAKILARAVNCEHPVDGNPCNQCPACLGIENGSILDVLELDAASNNGVDQVRALRDEAVYTPAAVRKRVYIVDEVHMLSTAAFNALLKILEEPPAHLMFILATTELHKVPATIKSRCQQFSFKRILAGDIARRLSYVAGRRASGSLRRERPCWPGWPTAACGTRCPCWTSVSPRRGSSGSRRCSLPWALRAIWRPAPSWIRYPWGTPPARWRPLPGSTVRAKTWGVFWVNWPDWPGICSSARLPLRGERAPHRRL